MLGNMPWQYVNFMNCMVFGEEGMKGGWLSLGALRMHMMYGLRRAKHVHVVSRLMHCRSHGGLGLGCLVAYVNKGEESCVFCWIVV